MTKGQLKVNEAQADPRRRWVADDVWRGLHASGATPAVLPRLSQRAEWLLEAGPGLEGALHLLHSEAHDADAMMVAAFGLPFRWAVAWGHGCVGTFAAASDLDQPAERALRIVAEWTESPADAYAWEALRLGALLGPDVAAGWLAQGLARLVHPSGLDESARWLAARFALVAATGLAIVNTDDRHGLYPARQQLCVQLALAGLGHV